MEKNEWKFFFFFFFYTSFFWCFNLNFIPFFICKFFLYVCVCVYVDDKLDYGWWKHVTKDEVYFFIWIFCCCCCLLRKKNHFSLKFLRWENDVKSKKSTFKKQQKSNKLEKKPHLSIDKSDEKKVLHYPNQNWMNLNESFDR